MWVLFSAFNLSFFFLCAKLGALRVFLALLLVVFKFFLNGYLSVLLMVAIDWLFVSLGFKVEAIDLVFCFCFCECEYELRNAKKKSLFCAYEFFSHLFD